MRILLLTQIIPYPPDAGPKIKTWHVLRFLVDHGHQVTLASFVRKEEEKYVDDLRKICHAVYTVPIHRSRLADIFYWFRSQVTRRPFLVERDDLPAMVALVRRLLVTQPVDVIHADQLTMAQFALCSRGRMPSFTQPNENGKVIDDSNPSPEAIIHDPPALIFDAHNAVWTILERMSMNARWFLKPVITLESHRVKRYEGRIIRSFDHTLAVTETDRQALLAAESFAFKAAGSEIHPPITVIPIAVDTKQIQPVRRKPGSQNIITIGTLHYPPNADGIRWFLREVFPLICQHIPEATITVVGKNPPQDLLRLANHKIKFTGYVTDLTPLFEESAVMVVPVRAGGGMRVRILDGFARAIPMVTTTIGLEGIDAQPGKEVVVRDEPDQFAAAVIELIQDEALQFELANTGRRLVEKCYDWEIVLQRMELIYQNKDRRSSGLEVETSENK
jgi:polysaccharide biosynthesis protein PslH